MIIPHDLLSPEALQGVIEAFVTLEGTDYGEEEVPLPIKVAQVRRPLEDGSAVIVFNEDEDSCTILPKELIPDAAGEP
jgi:uncharacterized protein YheU (UPF0270 family)